MKNGPELWDACITALKPHISYGIVAGGAVRDWFLDTPPKDIDLFVWGIKNHGLGLFHSNYSDEKFPQLPFPQAYSLSKPNSPEYENLRAIDQVWETNLYGHQANIISIDTKKFPTMDKYRVIQGFDFGIVQCFYDGDQIYDSYEAGLDRVNQTVTVYNKRNDEKVKERFERFNKRHKNKYKLVVL